MSNLKVLEKKDYCVPGPRYGSSGWLGFAKIEEKPEQEALTIQKRT